jgi:hypothetical protein
VTEQYAEFVVTEATALANSGMVAGTYTLRGERTYDRDTSSYIVDENYISSYYEANKEAIKKAFGYATNPSRCSESGSGLSTSFGCSVFDGLSAYTLGNGHIYAGNTGGYNCSVIHDGFAYCYW